MKIAWFKTNISPEIGCHLAGYSLNDISVAKLDDLFMTGLCMDDGERKVLLVSFDLIGLDEQYIKKNRKLCTEILHIPEHAVMLTPTHTHTGPESRSIGSRPEQIHRKYLDELSVKLCDEVRGLTDFRECRVAFYSSYCDENRNRRYVTADNHTTFTPHRREVVPIANGFADKELGQLMFFDSKTHLPLYVIGNYAAHPLAGHSPGLGGLRISADYPGAFRDYVTANTGAECMFVSGAAGDMVPREDEQGEEAMRSMGIRLGKAAIAGLCDSARNPGRFMMADAKVGSCIKSFTVPLRRRFADGEQKSLPLEYRGLKEVTLEIQCLSIGDICFVGVPGELCAELGQEIKWHSPFRRTFIAYDATAYFDYIAPANFLVSGGYEGCCQRFTARSSLQLVNTAVDAMFALRESLYPSQGEPYPDGLLAPLVDIPKN